MAGETGPNREGCEILLLYYFDPQALLATPIQPSSGYKFDKAKAREIWGSSSSWRSVISVAEFVARDFLLLMATDGVFSGGNAGLISLSRTAEAATEVAVEAAEVGVEATGTARVFWSGGKEAMNAAMQYAKSTGGTTLEMTRAGQNLVKLTKGLPWEEAAPMWRRLSTQFAKGASNEAYFFTTASGPRAASIWLTVEKPILLQNGVRIITPY